VRLRRAAAGAAWRRPSSRCNTCLVRATLLPLKVQTNALSRSGWQLRTATCVTGALVGITAAAQSVNGATASALRTLQINESSDEDPDPSAVPAATSAGTGAESVAATDSRSSTPLSPIPESPAARAATMAIVRASENLASEKKGERQDQKSNELASRKRQNELAVKQEAKLQPNKVVVLDGDSP